MLKKEEYNKLMSNQAFLFFHDGAIYLVKDKPIEGFNFIFNEDETLKNLYQVPFDFYYLLIEDVDRFIDLDILKHEWLINAQFKFYQEEYEQIKQIDNVVEYLEYSFNNGINKEFLHVISL